MSNVAVVYCMEVLTASKTSDLLRSVISKQYPVETSVNVAKYSLPSGAAGAIFLTTSVQSMRPESWCVECDNVENAPS